MEHLIPIPSIGNELSVALNPYLSQLDNVPATDVAVINLDEGTYYLEGTLVAKCSVHLSGKGVGATRIVILNSNLPTDDCFIRFGKTHFNEYGVFTGAPTSVVIHDLEISVQEHDDIWFAPTGDQYHDKHIIKIYYSSSVNIHDVKIRSANAYCTLIDLRDCSNVNINDCELINYNNCINGGIIWCRANTRNVTITNNRIAKYGNDEIIAIWDTSGNDFSHGDISNVLIAGNEIIYKKPFGAASIVADVLFSLYNSLPSAGVEFSNIRIVDNDFKISAPIHSLFSFRFKDVDSHSAIAVSSNNILFTGLSSASSSRFVAFSIEDSSPGSSIIAIDNNVISTAMETTDSNGFNTNVLIKANGGRIVASGNTVSGLMYRKNDKPMGIAVYWPQGSGNSLTLLSNRFRGINKIGQFSEGTGIADVVLTARNNTFVGDTRIYCDGVSTANLTFEGNTIVSECYEMLLQEFATTGTLVFVNNDVFILYRNSSGVYVGGRIFTHYNSIPLSNMYFQHIEVTGNEVHGADQSMWIPSNLNYDQNDPTNVMGNNSYYTLP